jgi:hypothetical protein
MGLDLKSLLFLIALCQDLQGIIIFIISSRIHISFARTTNNYSEHWNSTFLSARDKPILHCIHLILVHIAAKHFEFSRESFSHTSLNTWREAIAQRMLKSHGHQINQTGL